jgi:hypothetical protein
MMCRARVSGKKRGGHCGLLHAGPAWAVALARARTAEPNLAAPDQSGPVGLFFLFYFLFSFFVLVLGL